MSDDALLDLVAFAKRLDQVPPYLFAELERKIEEREKAGIDVISLGIGDPDLPTPESVIEALARAARNPGTHQYPSNRGTAEFRGAVARFYEQRFGVEIDPETEVIPVLGGKEGVAHVALATLDPARRWALLVAGLAISASFHGLLDALVPRSPIWGVLIEGMTFFLMLTYVLKARGLASAEALTQGLLEPPPLPTGEGPAAT